VKRFELGYGPAMSSEPQTPGVVEDLALGAFRLVKERIAFELDFSAETLPVLDQYLLELRDEDGGAPDEKVVSVVAPCVGAYFGEVCRRTLGVAWLETPERYEAWRISGASGDVAFNPVGVALEALQREPVPGWYGHFEVTPQKRAAVDRALAASGPVREDDYYRLAVRHEVLEQTLSLLQRG